MIDAANVHRPPNVEVVLRSQDDLPRVAGEPDKIRQVMVNLLDNAIKYSPDGGRIEVELTASSASLRFAVHDDGLGVPPPEQRRIFEKFYRLDPNLTRGVGGTGPRAVHLPRARPPDERTPVGRLTAADGGGSTFAVRAARRGTSGLTQSRDKPEACPCCDVRLRTFVDVGRAPPGEVPGARPRRPEDHREQRADGAHDQQDHADRVDVERVRVVDVDGEREHGSNCDQDKTDSESMWTLLSLAVTELRAIRLRPQAGRCFL